MTAVFRRLGSVIVAGVESTLAIAVLAAVGMLHAIDETYRSGAASETAEGTFVVLFLGVWGLSLLTLLVFVGAHGFAVAARIGAREGIGGLADPLRRVGLEALGAAAVVALTGFGSLYAGGLGDVVAGSVVVALAVLLHVAVDGVGFLRRRLTAE